MKRNLKIKLIILCCVTIVLGVIIYSIVNQYCKYLSNQIYVPLHLIDSIKSKDEIKGTWWILIQGTNDVYNFESYYHVMLPKNDYKKHYMIVSAGRSIQRMVYRLDSKIKLNNKYDQNVNKVGYLGEETYSDEINIHMFYIYQIPPISILDIDGYTWEGG